MRILETKIDEYIHHTNDLTREMDSYVTMNVSSFNTYIYDAKNDNGDFYSYAIRYPGATRGHIELNEENIITNIKLYDSTKDIYRKEVEDILKKYIGMKLSVSS